VEVVVVVVVVVVLVVWWRPHLHRHQWIVPEYIRTLDSTALDSTSPFCYIGRNVGADSLNIPSLFPYRWIKIPISLSPLKMTFYVLIVPRIKYTICLFKRIYFPIICISVSAHREKRANAVKLITKHWIWGFHEGTTFCKVTPCSLVEIWWRLERRTSSQINNDKQTEEIDVNGVRGTGYGVRGPLSIVSIIEELTEWYV
jgi:hypothetical protein